MRAELATNNYFAIRDIAHALNKDPKNFGQQVKKAAAKLGITPKAREGNRGPWLGFTPDDADRIITHLNEKSQEKLPVSLTLPDNQEVSVPYSLWPYLKVVIDNHQKGRTSLPGDFSNLIPAPKTPLSPEQRILIVRKVQDLNTHLKHVNCKWAVVNLNKHNGGEVLWDLKLQPRETSESEKKPPSPKIKKSQEQALLTSSIKILSNQAEGRPMAENNNHSINLHLHRCLNHDNGENLALFDLGDDPEKSTEKLKQIFIKFFAPHLGKWVQGEFQPSLSKEQIEMINDSIANLEKQYREVGIPLVQKIAKDVCLYFDIPIPDKYRENIDPHFVWQSNRRRI